MPQWPPDLHPSHRPTERRGPRSQRTPAPRPGRAWDRSLPRHEGGALCDSPGQAAESTQLPPGPQPLWRLLWGRQTTRSDAAQRGPGRSPRGRIHVDGSTWRGAGDPQSIADDSRQTDESRRLQRTRAASLREPLEFLPHRIHQFKTNKKMLV